MIYKAFPEMFFDKYNLELVAFNVFCSEKI